MNHTVSLSKFSALATSLVTLVALGVGSLLLTGCAETLDTHGTVMPPSALQRLQIGQSSKDQVRQILGTPATMGTLNDDRWYYVNSVVGSTPFNTNNLKSRRVLVLDFDPATGLLQNLTERTAQDGRAIDPNQAATNTAGQTMGFFEQMFGNIGIK